MTLQEKIRDLFCALKPTADGSVALPVCIVNTPLVVEPSDAWEALFEAAVTSALENANITVSIDPSEPVTVVVDTTNGPVEITGTVTIDTSGGPIAVEVTSLPDVTLTAETINDLAVAIAGQTLTVELSDEQLNEIFTKLDSLQDCERMSLDDVCIATADGVRNTSVAVYNEKVRDLAGNLVSDTNVAYQIDPTSGAFVPYTLAEGEMFKLKNDAGSLDEFLNMECEEVLTHIFNFNAFDFDGGVFDAGFQHTATVNGTSVAGPANPGTWVGKAEAYVDTVAAVNALSGVTMTLLNDVAIADSGKPEYSIEYPVGTTVTIVNEHTGDVYTFSSNEDGSCSATFNDSNGDPIESGAPVEQASTANGKLGG